MLVLLNTHNLIKDGDGCIHTLGADVKWAEFNTLQEASELCRKYIEENNIGSSCFTGGMIFNGFGHHCGDVAYNGKVFDLDHDLIYNPYER